MGLGRTYRCEINYSRVAERNPRGRTPFGRALLNRPVGKNSLLWVQHPALFQAQPSVFVRETLGKATAACVMLRHAVKGNRLPRVNGREVGGAITFNHLLPVLFLTPKRKRPAPGR